MTGFPKLCDKCNVVTFSDENEFGEYICDDCEQNAAELAWERHCEDFHDGGATWHSLESMLHEQAEARKLT